MYPCQNEAGVCVIIVASPFDTRGRVCFVCPRLFYFFHSGKFTGLNRIQENFACQTIYGPSAILALEGHPLLIITLTRPTAPLLSCTFIPCGCSDELVRILATTPSVVIPSF